MALIPVGDRLAAQQPIGFQEVFGTLVVNFHNGSTLELSCSQSDAPPRIEVETPKGQC